MISKFKQPMEYNGWKYIAESQENKTIFRVIPSEGIEPPQSFYKYYSLSPNSVDALTHLYIYASHPEQLNDPFDCCQNVINIDHDDDVYNLWQELYPQFIKHYPNHQEQIKVSNEAFRTLFYKKCGIFCLSVKRNSEQMWALYAQHNGFRLEFDVAKFPFAYQGPFPIHYCKELPHISTTECGVITAALIQTNVKHEGWSYEQEWRLLVSNPEGIDMSAFGMYAEFVNRPDDHDRKFRYPLNALKSVTLGCDFFKDAQLDNRVFVSGDEITVVYHDDNLQTQILTFLSEVQRKYPLSVLLTIKNGNDKLEEIPVTVIKISKHTYHIIEQ